MDLPLPLSFVVAGGSVVGTEHRHALRNNQDGLALHAGHDVLVAVVTDGCSSGASSEVGARLGASWLAEAVPAAAGAWTAPEDVAREVTCGLLLYLREVARGLGHGEPLPRTVNEFFLFAFLVAVVRRDKAFVFGVGDGVYAVNGQAVALDPGQENAPPYTGYGLIGPMPAARVHHVSRTCALSSLVIATDGALDLLARATEPLVDGTLQGDLVPFTQEARYVQNPSLLQKRLVVIGERNKRLRDDTTVALIRRRCPGAAAENMEASWKPS